MRMYTRGGNDCVGEGCIVEYGEETWGTKGIFLVPRRTTRGHTRRWAVRLGNVHVARAKVLFPDETDCRGAPATAQIGDREDNVVLWDATRLRKVPAAAVPATAASSETDRGGGSAASGEGGGSSTTPVGKAVFNPDGSRRAITEAPISVSVGATTERGAGAGEELVTPSEPFFAGQLDGIEALSSASVAHSPGSSEGGNSGDGGTGCNSVHDTMDDVAGAELEAFSFLKVRVRNDPWTYVRRQGHQLLF